MKKDNVKDELLKKYKNVQNVIELKLSDQIIQDNLLLIDKTFKADEKCENEKNKNICGAGGYHFKLIYKNGKLVSTPYKCRKLLTNKNLVKSGNFLYSNINNNMFNNYLLKENILEQEEKNRVILINYLLMIKKEEEFKSFYLSGPFSSGKTYLISCLANELAANNKTVAYVIISEFLLDIKKRLNDKMNFYDLIDSLKNVDVLFLDELGNEKFSFFFHIEILYNVLNFRFMNDKKTIFISNYDLKDLLRNYKIGINDSNLNKSIKQFIDRIERITDDNLFYLTNKIKKNP